MSSNSCDVVYIACQTVSSNSCDVVYIACQTVSSNSCDVVYIACQTVSSNSCDVVYFACLSRQGHLSAGGRSPSVGAASVRDVPRVKSGRCLLL